VPVVAWLSPDRWLLRAAGGVDGRVVTDVAGQRENDAPKADSRSRPLQDRKSLLKCAEGIVISGDGREASRNFAGEPKR
jgi:hypothetical protein